MRIIVLFFCILLVMQTNAQLPKEKTLLWKISGKGITSPSYLYGTFHLLCPDDFKMPDTIHTLFKTIRQVFFEVKLDDAAIMQKMMTNIIMHDGHNLHEYVSEQEFDSANHIFQKITRIPLIAVASYKPFMITSMLYPYMLGCTPIAFEKEFEKMAKEDSLSIKGLESIEDQLNIFDTIPYKEQAKALLKGLFELDKNKLELAKEVELYKTMDLKALLENSSSDIDISKYEDLLVNNRNNRWIPIIEKAIVTNPIFIAVGAGHLGGKKGLIYLLRKRGYQVTPVIY